MTGTTPACRMVFKKVMNLSWSIAKLPVSFWPGAISFVTTELMVAGVCLPLPHLSRLHLDWPPVLSFTATCGLLASRTKA